jgi:hypothetical protein
VTVANIGIQRRMKCRNEPVLRAHTDNGVEERKTIILRGREGRVG